MSFYSKYSCLKRKNKTSVSKFYVFNNLKISAFGKSQIYNFYIGI